MFPLFINTYKFICFKLKSFRITNYYILISERLSLTHSSVNFGLLQIPKFPSEEPTSEAYEYSSAKVRSRVMEERGESQRQVKRDRSSTYSRKVDDGLTEPREKRWYAPTTVSTKRGIKRRSPNDEPLKPEYKKRKPGDDRGIFPEEYDRTISQEERFDRKDEQEIEVYERKSVKAAKKPGLPAYQPPLVRILPRC